MLIRLAYGWMCEERPNLMRSVLTYHSHRHIHHWFYCALCEQTCMHDAGNRTSFGQLPSYKRPGTPVIGQGLVTFAGQQNAEPDIVGDTAHAAHLRCLPRRACKLFTCHMILSTVVACISSCIHSVALPSNAFCTYRAS